MRKEIVFTYPDLSGHGGIETVLIGLFNNWTRDEKIHLFLPGGSKSEAWLEKIVNRSEITLHHKQSKLSQFFDTFIYILSHKPSMVIVMSKWQIIPIFLTKIFNHSLKVVSWNHFSLSITKSVGGLKLLKLCDYHLSISSGITEQLESLGISRNKIFTVYNPVKRSAQFIERSNDSVKRMIYIGRVQFEDQKNLEEMFLILSNLHEIEWKLSIIGSGEDSSIYQLKHLARKLNIDSSIEWIGWRKQPWNAVVTADACLLTSNFEGFPMSLLEAVAHGVPIFSSDCLTGPKDIVNKNNGVMYSLHDISDGANKLQLLLENPQTYLDSRRVASTINQFYEDKYYLAFEKSIKRMMN